MRDALVRGQDAAVCLRDRRRLFARPPRGVGGVVEGYELAIRRLDRLLSRFDVRRVETVGQPFDGRVMHAVEARSVDRIGTAWWSRSCGAGSCGTMTCCV